MPSSSFECLQSSQELFSQSLCFLYDGYGEPISPRLTSDIARILVGQFCWASNFLWRRYYRHDFVEPSITKAGALLIIVLIWTFLSFSLETEIEGCWLWERARTRNDARSRSLDPDGFR